jgi:hypothetical protein
MSTQGGGRLAPQFVQRNRGTTAQRPAKALPGQVYYDTTLAAGGQPVWCRDASSSPQEWCTSDGGLSALPTVTSLVPDNTPAAGGGVITVHGSSFFSATDVLVDGVSVGAEGVAWNHIDDTTLNFDAPAHGAGPVFVQVVGPIGTSTTGPGSTLTYT